MEDDMIPRQVAIDDYEERRLFDSVLHTLVEYNKTDNICLADATRAYDKIVQMRFKRYAPKDVVCDGIKVLLMYFAYRKTNEFLPRLASYCGLEPDNVEFDESFLNCNNAFHLAVKRKMENQGE